MMTVTTDVAPRKLDDVRLLSWLVLAISLVDAVHPLGVLFVPIDVYMAAAEHRPLVPPVLEWLAMAARLVITLVAAYQLRVLRSWARWWLVCAALVSLGLFVQHPPDAAELGFRWRQWMVGGGDSFDAFHWVA